VNTSTPDQTSIACLTPPGQAAIATLGLHGPEAWRVVQQVFQPRSGKPLPPVPAAGQFWLGRIAAELGDEVVLAVKQAEPVPWLEIHGHGGREVVRVLLDVFLARGLHLCTWQQFLTRTSGDPLRAEAAAALAHAPTTRTAAILLDQYHGAFGSAVAGILAALERGDTGEALTTLTNLARHSALGQHLTAPWRVVIAGAPNVGKSSLANALAGYQRSVVAPTPGTTRDVVTTRLAIDGWPIELADTAGLRSEAGRLEHQGIQLARSTLADADLCVWLLDASTEPTFPDQPAPQVHLVVNKIDLPAAWDLNRATGALRVSAQTGVGLDELCAALSRWLVPDVPPPGAAVPFTAAQGIALEQARRLIAAGQVAEGQQVLRDLTVAHASGTSRIRYEPEA
jgi:tRNA modification GTPase